MPASAPINPDIADRWREHQHRRLYRLSHDQYLHESARTADGALEWSVPSSKYPDREWPPPLTRGERTFERLSVALVVIATGLILALLVATVT